MSDVAFGETQGGVRFGLRRPSRELEAGSNIVLEIVCENRSSEPVRIFGFAMGYPRALRVSPPKEKRPYIRVSFGDTSVLHPPEAFVTIPPGEWAVTGLDVSFAFDRRGVGLWPIAFAYDAVRGTGRIAPFSPAPGTELSTAVVEIAISGPRSLRQHGIDEAREADLERMLQDGEPRLLDALAYHGEGGLAFAARRISRISASGVDSRIGFRALAMLARLGPKAIAAVAEARVDMPHAEAAFRFADRWLRHRLGESPAEADMPFVTMLERLADQPEMRGNFLLVWQPCDLAIHGTRRVDVLGSGDTIVSIRPPGATIAATTRTMLTSAEMQGLLLHLRREAVHLIEPMREHGLPDEPRPTLEVQLALGDPFIRRIAAWNGEWRQGPAASLADYLDRLFDPAKRSSLAQGA